MKELPITPISGHSILKRWPPLSVCQDEMLEEATLPALMIVGAGLIP